MSTDFCVENLLRTMNSSSSSPSHAKEDSDKNVPQIPTSEENSSTPESSQKAPSFEESEFSKETKNKTKKRKTDKENEQPAKRSRVCFSTQQLICLEKMFAENPYPDKLLKDEVAENLSLPYQKIHVSMHN